jgi:hypothetical protein
MSKTTRRRSTLVTLALLTVAGCRAKSGGGAAGAPAPSAADFSRGLQAYIERRGDLCVGRPSWPIDVPEGSRLGPDPVQLPVLERLGVVTSTVLAERREGVATPFNMRRYRLTAEGRKHYIDRDTRLPVSPDDPHAGRRVDFCVLKLTTGTVTKWELQPGATPTATVSYRYGVDAPAWVRDPAFQRVFPAIARFVAGAGTAELVEGFTLRPEGWTANELLPAAPAPGQATASR